MKTLLCREVSFSIPLASEKPSLGMGLGPVSSLFAHAVLLPYDPTMLIVVSGPSRMAFGETEW